MRIYRLHLAAALFAVLLSFPGAAAAQTFVFEYAVKVVCGSGEQFTVPGRYATVVNVHNPSRETTRFRFKVAVAGPLRQDTISTFRDLSLRPDGALAISCRDVVGMTGRSVVDGFVVIQTLIDLDVAAVYTAAGSAGVSSVEVERQTPRRMSSLGGASPGAGLLARKEDDPGPATMAGGAAGLPA